MAASMSTALSPLLNSYGILTNTLLNIVISASPSSSTTNNNIVLANGTFSVASPSNNTTSIILPVNGTFGLGITLYQVFYTTIVGIFVVM